MIGLKYFTTGAWPYFGPDVTNTIQIPGALQGLAVGLPFSVLPVPEAPYIFLNLLSFASLGLFAWYCTKRLPNTPKWFAWSWLLTAPWTVCMSTHIFNPSYVLPGAVVFFIAALETYPSLSLGLISLRWSNFMMGAALFWVMQFHLSWILLIPYILLSFYFQSKGPQRTFVRSMIYFGLGAALTGAFLVPTFLRYGINQGMGGTNETAQFNVRNLFNHLNIVEGVLGRFLSFASFELPRFIGPHTASRLAFIRENLWLLPFVVFLTVVGILQPLIMVVLFFKKNHSEKSWKPIKYFTLGTVGLLYVSFLFSVKAPHSHTFYLTLPVAMLYSFYCWNDFLRKKRWQKFALVVLICGVIFEVGLAVSNYKRTSLYVNRAKIVKAIEARDYRLLDERRPGTRY